MKVSFLKYMLLTAILFTGFTWLTMNPGTISLSWLGYEIQTSITFLFFVIFLLVAVSHALSSGWQGLLWFFKGILNIGSYLKKDPNKILAEAFSQIEFENYSEAKTLAKQAMNLSPEAALPAIALLKAAQKSGDTRTENVALTHLKKFDSFAPMAFYDEIESALRTQKLDNARKILKQMATEYGDENWFIKQSLKVDVMQHKWESALIALDKLVQKSGINTADANRMYSHIWYNLAQNKKISEPERLSMMEKAYEYDPLHLDNLIDLSRTLIDRKDKRAAQSILEKAWNDFPSWRISEAYCELFSDNTPIKRAQKARKLYDIRPDHPVSQLILIRYFIDAKLWGEAKRVLHLIPKNVPEAYVLKAALAKKEKGDIEKTIDHMQSAVKQISYPYKCTSCRKSAETQDVMCKHCGSFLTLHLKHPITFANCVDALD